MSVVDVRTFKDIQDAIIRRAKLEDTTANRTDLKEYINTYYQRIGREEFYRWSGENGRLKLRAKYTTGTLTATNDSDQVTGDGTAWDENTHRFSRLWVSGSNQNFKIIRVGSTTTMTLDQPYTGTTTAGLSYTIYRDEYGLFPDFQGMRKLRIPGLARRNQPRPCGPNELDMLRDQSPFRSGTPLYYTVFGKSVYTEKTWATFNVNYDFWEDDLDDAPRNDSLVVWPSILTTDTIATVRYTKILPGLGADADEPLMPRGDRSILVWGVLKERFLVNRDPTTKREWDIEYMSARKKMAADIETTDDELILVNDLSRYSRRAQYVDEDDLRVP